MAWCSRHVDILIAMPHSGGEVYFDWSMNFAQVFKHAPPNTFIISAPEPQIDTAREKLCEMALNMGAKYMFWLDTDVLPPVDVIDRLLRDSMKHNAPIVSGLYARRHHPCFNEMMLYGKDAQGNEGFIPIAEGQYEKDSVIFADAVGFGCVLLKTEILKHVEKPWFRWTEHKTMSGLSEDFYFCKKAREAGFRVVVDTSVVCRHMGPIKILPSTGAQGLFEFKAPGNAYTDI